MNRSMTQVDQITQRTATASEELAAASEQMSAQADALRQLSDFFTLDESAITWSHSTPRGSPNIGKSQKHTNLLGANLAHAAGGDHEFRPF